CMDSKGMECMGAGNNGGEEEECGGLQKGRALVTDPTMTLLPDKRVGGAESEVLQPVKDSATAEDMSRGEAKLVLRKVSCRSHIATCMRCQTGLSNCLWVLLIFQGGIRFPDSAGSSYLLSIIFAELPLCTSESSLDLNIEIDRLDYWKKKKEKKLVEEGS
ncbi:hypothetical protein BHE74_00011552, partial [Ensete ventricosum]